MDLTLNEMQELLRRTAREFFEKECPKSMVRWAETDQRGYSPEFWQKLAHQGWLSMALPPAYGGAGASFLDLCVLYEEMGRALAPSPFFELVLAQHLLLDLASESQKSRYLPGMGTGSHLMVVAYTEPSGRYEPGAINLPATPQGNGWVLNGSKLFVANAHNADTLLVVARTRPAINKEDGLTVFLVDPNANGVRMTLLDTIASDKQCEIVFDNVALGPEAVVGPLHGAWPALRRYLDRAAVLTSVWSVGGADQVLEMAVEYAKNRTQFGRPIGSFQAVAHKCVDMSIDCDGMRASAYHAAWRLSEGLPADQEIAIAKAWTANAYRRVTAMGTQVHGGVGYMMEYDVQLYFRRAKAAELAFGHADIHRELVAQGLGL